ncbi:hypothetical protein [Vannielia litorea]|nr:hypothetical protein [Vannielia litorea]
MMKTKITLIALALSALAACSSAPIGTTPVQQLDSRAVWSTGSYR